MKKLLSVLMAAGMMFYLAACNKPAEVKETAKNEQTDAPAEVATDAPAAAEELQPASIRVAYMGNLGSVSSIVAAKEFGFFDEQKLDVKLEKFAGGPAEIAAMASGDIDISQIGHGAHKLCIEGKAVIFQMDATSLADAVIGNKEKGVNTLEDLKGKTVATTAGTSSEVILKLALASVNLKPEDLNIIEMDANGVVPAMISGQIDACATWSPGTFKILQQMGDKAVNLADNSKYLDKAAFPSSFITTEKYAKEHRDILVRFATAIQKAQDKRISDLDEVVKKTAQLIEANEEDLLLTKNEGNWNTSGATFLKTALQDGTVKALYQTQQDMFIADGKIPEKVDLDKYIMFDIMEEANALALK